MSQKLPSRDKNGMLTLSFEEKKGLKKRIQVLNVKIKYKVLALWRI